MATVGILTVSAARAAPRARQAHLAGWLAAAAALFGAGQGAIAQERPQSLELPPWASVTQTVERRAFVLAIADYRNLEDLPSAARDGSELQRSLEAPELGFKVTRPLGVLDRGAILDAFDVFLATVRAGDTVLFYFSGHGFETDGANFIAPSGLEIEPGQTVDDGPGLRAIALEHFMHEIRTRGAGLTILILDACRTDVVPPPPLLSEPLSLPGLAEVETRTASTPPQEESALRASEPQEGPPGAASERMPFALPGASSGFGKIPGGRRVFIGYAAGPGEPSYGRRRDDTADRPSIFTRSFVERVPAANAFWTEAFNEIHGDVMRLTEDQQEPWISAAGFPPRLVLNQTQSYAAEREKAWREAVLAAPGFLPGALCSFLKAYPDSPHTVAARDQLVELQRTLPQTQWCNSM